MLGQKLLYYIVDGSALINALSPRASKTFEEYTNKDVIPTVEAFLAEIGLEKLWLAFGQGANLRWIPIHDSRNNIGPDKAKGITFSTPVLDVMLSRLSVEKVKVQHGKSWMFILKLQWYLPTSVRIHQ